MLGVASPLTGRRHATLTPAATGVVSFLPAPFSISRLPQHPSTRRASRGMMMSSYGFRFLRVLGSAYKGSPPKIPRRYFSGFSGKTCRTRAARERAALLYNLSPMLVYSGKHTIGEYMASSAGAPDQNGLEEKIKAWVRKAGWSIRALPPDEPLWAFTIHSSDESIPVLLYSLPGMPDAVVVQAEITINPGQQAQIDKMRRNREELYLNLQSLLFKHHMEFIIDPGFKNVVLMARLFDGGLDQNLFWSTVIKVRSASLDTLVFLRQQLGGAPLVFDSKPN